MRECNKSDRIGQALSAMGDPAATRGSTNPHSLISRKISACALLQPMPVDAPHRSARVSFVQDNGKVLMQ
jgi:hypothetical protein